MSANNEFRGPPNIASAGSQNSLVVRETIPSTASSLRALSEYASRQECEQALQQSSFEPCGERRAEAALLLLQSFYSSTAVDNPEAFNRAGAAALADYPEELVAAMVSPRTGIVRESKWLPSIAEMIRWCEERLQCSMRNRDLARARLAVIDRRELLDRQGYIIDEPHKYDAFEPLKAPEIGVRREEP